MEDLDSDWSGWDPRRIWRVTLDVRILNLAFVLFLGTAALVGLTHRLAFAGVWIVSGALLLAVTWRMASRPRDWARYAESPVIRLLCRLRPTFLSRSGPNDPASPYHPVTRVMSILVFAGSGVTLLAVGGGELLFDVGVIDHRILL
jgi:hypothetical protein